MSKYGVFPGAHFPVLGLNTDIYSVNLPHTDPALWCRLGAKSKKQNSIVDDVSTKKNNNFVKEINLSLFNKKKDRNKSSLELPLQMCTNIYRPRQKPAIT